MKFVKTFESYVDNEGRPKKVKISTGLYSYKDIEIKKVDANPYSKMAKFDGYGHYWVIKTTGKMKGMKFDKLKKAIGYIDEHTS